MKKKLLTYIVAIMLISATPSIALAFSYTYQIEVFTNNGTYSDGETLDFFVVASNHGTSPDMIDFTIHNESSIRSSIARVYFDFDDALTFYGLTNGDGVNFSIGARPRELPAARTLEPRFESEYSFGSDAPRPHNGINPGEQLQVTFNLFDSITAYDIIEKMNSGQFRIGTHIIAMPGGTSEAAVTIPEPTTIALLALGTLVMRKRRS